MQRRRGGDEEGEETPSRVAEGGIAVTTPQEATVSWGELPRCPPASKGVVCAWDQARTSTPRSPLGRRKPTVGLKTPKGLRRQPQPLGLFGLGSLAFSPLALLRGASGHILGHSRPGGSDPRSRPRWTVARSRPALTGARCLCTRPC